MPESVETPLSLCWANLPNDHTVSVRYPYEKHGFAGKVSNNDKVITKELFLKFVDNRHANGRRLDSRNPTHYLFPKFKTISEPKRNVSAYNEKTMSSPVYEFNRTQRKASLNTISSQTALSSLKVEGPKTAIYPHQSDDCDYCSRKKMDIQRCAQSISRGTCKVAVVPLRILKNTKRKRKIYKMTWKNTARLPENLCSTIVIL